MVLNSEKNQFQPRMIASQVQFKMHCKYFSGHLSAVRKWGGKTTDYAKSGGTKSKKIWQL